MSQAVHWNKHIVCALDFETSGTDPEKHDILQIAVVPLNGDLTPNTDIGIFEMNMAPIKKEADVDPKAMSVNKLDWRKQRDTCLDPFKVSELFEEWWENLKLPIRKSIIPLAHNYPFEHKFLYDWLGPAAMSHYFFSYRDTMAIANMLNDIADFRSEPWPFPKTDLGYLCSQMHVENYKPHDALADSIATAECYRKMVMQYRIV